MAAQWKFKKGDQVVCPTGGPPMMINALPGEKVVGHGTRDDEYHCRWFKGATQEWGWFGEHMLEPYKRPAVGVGSTKKP